MSVAEITQSEPKLKRLMNPNGRPSAAQRMARLSDEGQAYEIIKDKWTLISDTLADEALKAARSRKKDGKSLVATCTAAGIAYDKRWAKQAHDNTELGIPPSLAAALTKKLANHYSSKSTGYSGSSAPKPGVRLVQAGHGGRCPASELGWTGCRG